ncbi:hypothetical protein O181_075062 [Austropuccinia psidii MF-1]|uniref:Uncharacterized protein n=1 Tax=Austropuccinia psidii MF-1 TaxID=1389203 RepID=A0A9Q3ICJ3_9BASI|nr:hypothetical protein [Austropuccinia psidii MF-1]
MPIQHLPPARQTISQARTQAVLTPTPRAPLDVTAAVPQLRAQLDRGPCMEGRKRANKIKFILRGNWQISRTFKDHSQSSSQKKKKNFQKRDKPHSFLFDKEFKQGLITLNFDHKDNYDPSRFFSNDFPSAKSCAALVGDSKAPSFPSSVHIPSLNSHPSLLSSRDEIFKGIQDVGEDNSVASLHLFFGNMDLPPSSYHDSLEELWDEKEEPEEVETVLKVVPSAYHQYLDVFSKVKA